MEDEKLYSLCSHYRDSFLIHRASIKQRDFLFYVLLVILAVFTLQVSFSDAVYNALFEYIKKSIGVELVDDVAFLSTMLWFLLVGFSVRYFQVVIEIERQYDYLHSLERILNTCYPGTNAFTREGEGYLKEFSLFSNWIWLIYTLVFPCVIVFCIIFKITNQIEGMESIGVNEVLDFMSYLLVGTTVVLYVVRFHQRVIGSIVNYLGSVFNRTV